MEKDNKSTLTFQVHLDQKEVVKLTMTGRKEIQKYIFVPEARKHYTLEDSRRKGP